MPWFAGVTFVLGGAAYGEAYDWITRPNGANASGVSGNTGMGGRRSATGACAGLMVAEDSVGGERRRDTIGMERGSVELNINGFTADAWSSENAHALDAAIWVDRDTYVGEYFIKHVFELEEMAPMWAKFRTRKDNAPFALFFHVRYDLTCRSEYTGPKSETKLAS